MTLNVPYKKQYKNGVVINPIKGFYPGKKYLYTDREGVAHFAPTRRQRRGKSAAINNRKMRRSRANRQFIPLQNGSVKVIAHNAHIKATGFGR